MADERRTQDNMLDRITDIRVKNNDLWMGILAIALEAAPETTKRLIREIAKNDAAITLEMNEIANAPINPD